MHAACISKILQAINSGNRNVIYFIYFSSVEIDINFLLVFPCLGAGHLSPSRGGGGGVLLGIIIKIFVGFRGSFVDKGSLPGGPD